MSQDFCISMEHLNGRTDWVGQTLFQVLCRQLLTIVGVPTPEENIRGVTFVGYDYIKSSTKCSHVWEQHANCE